MPAQYPTHGQTDVLINKSLVYIFSKDVKETSLYTGAVALYDAKDHHLVEGVLSYDQSTFTVQFLPAQALSEDTSYTWSFAGLDDADTIPIEFVDNTQLTNSIWIDFQTGRSRVETATNVSASPLADPIVIADGQTVDERAADVFKVINSTPSNLSSFINVLTNTITVEFSSDIKVGQVLDDLITLHYEPLVRETFYFNTSNFKNTIVDIVPGSSTIEPSTATFQMPAGNWTIDPINPKKLIWTKNDTLIFNANAYIYITISGDLLDINDVALNSKQDEILYFLTMIFPMFTNIESILYRLSGLRGFIAEEDIIKGILFNSLEAHRIGKTSLVTPTSVAQRYTECATAIELLDNKSLQRQLNRGKSIRLGELNVNYEFPRQTDVESSTIRNELASCLDDTRNELLFSAGNYEFLIGIRGANTNIVHDVYRNRIPFGYKPGYDVANIPTNNRK